MLETMCQSKNPQAIVEAAGARYEGRRGATVIFPRPRRRSATVSLRRITHNRARSFEFEGRTEKTSANTPIICQMNRDVLVTYIQEQRGDSGQAAEREEALGNLTNAPSTALT